MDLTGVGGIWPASLTPFDPAGAIDAGALRSHIQDLAATPGVRAVVVNGHAGEVSALDRAERQAVVRLAREAAGPGTGIVAGVVAEDTRGACHLAQDAAAAGADALLLFPPSLFAGGLDARPDMAVRFVSAVAASCPLPIVLFQLPQAAGPGYSPALLARLCRKVPSIIAVKEGSDVPQTFEDTLLALRGCGRRITILTTNNTWLFASLAYGVDGILSGCGSVLAAPLAEMLAASARGDVAGAREVNNRMLPLLRVFYRRPSFDIHNRMKTALHLLGKLPHPAPRPPLLPITAVERAEIAQALHTAGLLRAEAA